MMKSNAIWDHGQLGVENGLNTPVTSKLDNLSWVQTGQARSYSQTSLAKDSSQN